MVMTRRQALTWLWLRPAVVWVEQEEAADSGVVLSEGGAGEAGREQWMMCVVEVEEEEREEEEKKMKEKASSPSKVRRGC